MPKIPDRFDLWIRKARECPDPDRQSDYVLGALAGLKEWHFLNIGTTDRPHAAKTQLAADSCVLVFTDLGRIEDLIEQSGADRHLSEDAPLPAITVATESAMKWCVECKVGLLINPSEDAVMIPFEQVKSFHEEWTRQGGRAASGYWIPNMTSEEEDFWQEHGL
jgi:hypothetical protein